MLTFLEFLEEQADQRRIKILSKDKYLDKAHMSLSKSVDKTDVSNRGVAALRHYTDDSKHINREIRKAYNSGKSFGEVLSTKNDRTRIHLDHAISKTKPLKSSTHVYHGTTVDPRKDTHNGVWTNKNYTSTTLNPSHTHYFRNSEKGHIIHFHLPKGSKHGLYADALNRTDVGEPEHEYILAHGQKWKHVGSEHVKDGYQSYTLHHMVPHKD